MPFLVYGLDGLPEVDGGQNACSFGADGVELVGIDAEGLEDCGSDLGCANFRKDCSCVEARVGKQEHDVGVVMGESAVLGELLAAAGVDDADIRGHDNIRSARIDGWVVVVKGKRRAEVDLAEADLVGVLLEDLDAGSGVRGVLQPDERDIVFRRSNASGVDGGLGVWNVAGAGKQVAGEVPVLRMGL